jgi:hypothetical protein
MSALWAILVVLFAVVSAVALGDLASRRVRGYLDRLPHWIIGRAVLRVPAELRDELADEWTSELTAVLRSPRVLPVGRLARAIPFTLGLLRSGPSIGQALGAVPGQEPDPVRPVADSSVGRETASAGLSERERAVLVFEKQYWKYAGAKEQAIRDRFGISATGYYRLLNTLIDQSDALDFEPVLVRRLRRQRQVRQNARGTARSSSPTEGTA